MAKIKVIDLLNRISKGESVPEYIKDSHNIEYKLETFHNLPTYYDKDYRTLLERYNFGFLNENVE